MADIIYEELIFPEVEELPRDIPVVIPLGTGDLPDSEGTRLVMPSLPYGFEGWLAVPAFERLLESLKEVLAEDGFHQVATQLTGSPVPDTTGDFALLSIGHTEQHGFHLPLSTDTIIARGLASGLAARLPELAVLPTWPYGVSTHRRQFPGTLTVEPRVWEDFWVEIVGRLSEHGFRKAYLLNGHGGNHSFLVNVVKFAGERYREMFVATSFLHTSSGQAASTLVEERTSKLMGHACELETSYVLALRPELVRMELAVDEIDFVITPRYGVDWVSDGVLVANPCWTDDSITGSYGAPTVATREKGERWMQQAVQELHEHLNEVSEQWRLREQRRHEGWTEGAWRVVWERTRQEL